LALSSLDIFASTVVFSGILCERETRRASSATGAGFISDNPSLRLLEFVDSETEVENPVFTTESIKRETLSGAAPARADRFFKRYIIPIGLTSWGQNSEQVKQEAQSQIGESLPVRESGSPKSVVKTICLGLKRGDLDATGQTETHFPH
jgi:hypothetical protein